MKIINYQFITWNLYHNQQHKIILMVCILLFSTSLKSQEMIPDSIQIIKQWNDKNGKNILSIKVNALCNPDKPPYDGHETMIEASLQNKNCKVDTFYNEQNYETKMILFYKEDISFYKINGIHAVFIPFFFCSNADSEKTVTYIIFFNKKKYLIPVKYNCNDNGACKLAGKLDDVAKDILPVQLRSEFTRQIKSYRTTKHFHAD